MPRKKVTKVTETIEEFDYLDEIQSEKIRVLQMKLLANSALFIQLRSMYRDAASENIALKTKMAEQEQIIAELRKKIPAPETKTERSCVDFNNIFSAVETTVTTTTKTKILSFSPMRSTREQCFKDETVGSDDEKQSHKRMGAEDEKKSKRSRLNSWGTNSLGSN
jgi:hypothetical protein